MDDLKTRIELALEERGAWEAVTPHVVDGIYDAVLAWARDAIGAALFPTNESEPCDD